MARKSVQQQTRDVYRERLKEVRKRRGWTQEELAAAMGKIGHPINRTTIAKIERGHRPMEVSELVAFAAVLDVQPASLYLPLDAETVWLTESLPVDADEAVEWARGTAPLNPENARSYYAESPSATFGPANPVPERHIRSRSDEQTKERP